MRAFWRAAKGAKGGKKKGIHHLRADVRHVSEVSVGGWRLVTTATGAIQLSKPPRTPPALRRGRAAGAVAPRRERAAPEAVVLPRGINNERKRPRAAAMAPHDDDAEEQRRERAARRSAAAAGNVVQNERLTQEAARMEHEAATAAAAAAAATVAVAAAWEVGCGLTLEAVADIMDDTWEWHGVPAHHSWSATTAPAVPPGCSEDEELDEIMAMNLGGL